MSSPLSSERSYCVFSAALSSLPPSFFRLCVAALSVNSFCGSREALYGVFDGDRNVEVPYLLQCTMNDVLAEEIHKTKSEEDYMTNTFLVMQRYTTASISLLSQIILILLLNEFFFFSFFFLTVLENLELQDRNWAAQQLCVTSATTQLIPEGASHSLLLMWASARPSCAVMGNRCQCRCFTISGLRRSTGGSGSTGPSSQR